MPLVNVASRLDAPVLMESAPVSPLFKPEFSYSIVGKHDPSAVAGWGITYAVDEATYAEWIAVHTYEAQFLKLVTDQDIADMAASETDPSGYGHQAGLVSPGSTPATSAVLIGGGFSDEELAGLVGDLAANDSAWSGFDIHVDGALHTVRQQFGGVQQSSDVCTLINAVLGPYAVTSMPGSAAPWSFVITSNTTGASSTISYAGPPSYLVEAADDDPRKQITDISGAMRLIAGFASVEHSPDQSGC